MSAPERFQVGDTVRCVDSGDKTWGPRLGATYTVTALDHHNGRDLISYTSDGVPMFWNAEHFILVSRPKPPALDPFAWTSETASSSSPLRYNIEGFIRWSRFCYWAAQSNLAAHFLPTEAAARTRASNGRDVPVATVLVELPVEVVHRLFDRGWTRGDIDAVIRACRRAMGDGA